MLNYTKENTSTNNWASTVSWHFCDSLFFHESIPENSLFLISFYLQENKIKEIVCQYLIALISQHPLSGENQAMLERFQKFQDSNLFLLKPSNVRTNRLKHVIWLSKILCQSCKFSKHKWGSELVRDAESHLCTSFGDNFESICKRQKCFGLHLVQ